MLVEGMDDRRELLDDLAQSPESDQARETVREMRNRIAAAEREAELG